jgi:hypothetical protein
MPGPLRSSGLQTQWQSRDLLVLREGQEVERLHADDIQRVILAHRHGGHSPGDLEWALVELPQDAWLLPPGSGIAGRIHFEHQEFWSRRHCVYWVDARQASLPRRLRLAGGGLFSRWRPDYLRVPRAEIAALAAKWPLQGPQSWEQRKWEHIHRTRLFAPLDAAMEEARRRGG